MNSGGIRYLVGLVGLMLIVGRVWAVPVDGLYDAQQLVASQQQDERIRAAGQALREVLVRVSGSRAILNNERVRQALASPQRYLNQFGYEETQQPLQLPNGNAVLAKRLTLNFQPTAINRLLQEAGLPVWGSNRPAVLVWAALEERGRRQVLDSEAEHPALNALWAAGRKRGVPLLLPLMDLEDERNISVSDVWGLFQQRVWDASQRYQPDGALAGRIYPLAGGGWAGSWLLLVKGEAIGFNVRANSVEELMGEAVDQVASQLAERYAVVASTGEAVRVRLHVRNVDSGRSYAAALEYLRSLAPVREALVSEVTADEMVFTLVLQGQVNQLEAVIALDHKLRPLSELDYPATPEVGALYYRWSAR